MDERTNAANSYGNLLIFNVVSDRFANVRGSVARSPVSANRWLRGIKTNRFPWYLTLVNPNHASSNPGQFTNNRSRFANVFSCTLVDKPLLLNKQKQRKPQKSRTNIHLSTRYTLSSWIQ